MMGMQRATDLEAVFTESRYPDQAMSAARARAMVWQLAQKTAQKNQSMTLAGLCATVTRSAARALGIGEDELVQLLRDHRPH